MTNFTFIQLDLRTILHTLVATLIDGCIIFLFCHYIYKNKKSKKSISKEQVSANGSDNEQRWD